MKIAERTLSKLTVAIVLSSLALFRMGRWVLSPTTSSTSTISAAGRSANATLDPPRRKSARRSAPFDLRLNLARLEIAESPEYRGSGRNIFSTLEGMPTEKIRFTPNPPLPHPMPVESNESSIPMKFFGFSTTPNAPKKIFLSQDGDVFVGTEGDIVDRRYRIVRIGLSSVDVEDLLENTRFTLALERG